MQPEKPKHKLKRKNGASTRNPTFVVIIGIVLVVGLAAAFLVPRLVPVRLHITDVEAVTIDDTWWGLAPGAPFDATYDLVMQDGMLVGTATFSAGDGGEEIHESVTIPAGTVEEFFKIMEEARLTEGTYAPLIEWTDDYPNISITFQTANGMIEVFTGSQGEEHIPWGASMRGKEYIIASGIPAQALAVLELDSALDVPDILSEATNHSP